MGGAPYVHCMRSLPLRRLVGLLALLVFALALPMQASMGASMASCGPAHAAMDHDGAKPDCGDAGMPLKATMSAPCAYICAPISALPAQVGAPVIEQRIVHVPAMAETHAGVVTAPDPFPPRATVLA
jgi:hypothetical protein